MYFQIKNKCTKSDQIIFATIREMCGGLQTFSIVLQIKKISRATLLM